MFMSDTLTLDAPRRTQDGYMAVRAKAARTGVYRYAGREVDPENKHGLRDQESVNVLRDAAQMFDQRAAHSFIGKPITNDHPRDAVNAGNWRDHARGTVMGAKWEEGGYLAFDLLLTDGASIAAVEGGKRELSNGYSSTLEFGDFAAPDGTRCPARQTNIVGNHIAIVDRGRAGPDCRIVDAATCDAAPQPILDSLTEKPVKTMLIDGLTVDIANAETAEATIKTILAARDTAAAKVAGHETTIATLTTDKATLQAEKVTLTQQLADASSPAKLRDAAKAYATIVGKARALGVAITDVMGQTEIVKAVVDAKIDASLRTGWTDAMYSASFASLAAGVKVTDADPLRTAITDQPANIADAAAREATALTKANDHNGWRTAGGNA